MIRFRRLGFVRYLIFPYWWLVFIRWIWQSFVRKKETSLLPDYVKYRQGLTSAKFRNGRAGSVAPRTSASPEQAVKWLYDLLSILDSKASALMRLNGVMLAASAFLLNAGHTEFGTNTIVRVGSDTILLFAALSSVSIAFCLLVVSVDWRFLGFVQETQNGNQTKLDYTEEMLNLGRVFEIRQFVYRTAWLVSFYATAIFVWTFVSPILG